MKLNNKTKKTLYKWGTSLVLCLIACGVGLLDIGKDTSKNTFDQQEVTTEKQESSFVNKETVEYVKKVDGDTAKFKLKDGKTYTCRFLAIDTPETVKPNTPIQPYGKEASAFTDEKLTNASTVYLEYDANSDKFDKYGRLLAWVWVDEKLLQEELVSNGLAEVKYIYGNYKYVDRLLEKQSEAKSQNVGVWK